MSRSPHQSAGWRALRHLCDEIGVRWAGTEGEHRAAAYLADQFRAFGLEVATPKVRYIGWEPLGEPEFTLLAPEEIAFPACPYYFAAPTPGIVEGRLEYVGTALLGINEGRDIGISGPPAAPAGGPDRYVLLDASGEPIASVVATGAEEPRPGGFTQFTEPVVQVGRSARERLAAWRATGVEVRARLRLPTRYNTAAYSYNVIATLPGTVHPERVLVIGAHYDSVYNTVGGFDNGSGVMALVDAAEQMVRRPLPVTVRFCAFGAEEFDFLGSRHYVLSLKERGELPRIVAMINLDAVGNPKEERARHHNFRVTDDRLRGAVERALSHFQVAERFGWTDILSPFPWRQVLFSRGSDYCFFAQEGVPAISCGANAGPHGHTPLDTIANMDPEVVIFKSEVIQWIAGQLAEE
jgi:aminopeptidase YwaD